MEIDSIKCKNCGYEFTKRDSSGSIIDIELYHSCNGLYVSLCNSVTPVDKFKIHILIQKTDKINKVIDRIQANKANKFKN